MMMMVGCRVESIPLFVDHYFPRPRRASLAKAKVLKLLRPGLTREGCGVWLCGAVRLMGPITPHSSGFCWSANIIIPCLLIS